MVITIRVARKNDLAEYLQLEKESLEHFIKMTKDKDWKINKKKLTETFEKVLKSRKSQIYFLEIGGKIAGHMTLHIENNKFRSVGYLDYLFIRKNYRGKGYGRLMTKEFMRLSKKANVKKIALSTRIENKKAQKLYESLRFKRIGINYGINLK